MSSGLLLLGGALGVLFVLAAVDLLIRRPRVVVGLVLAATVIDAAIVETPVGILVGGVSVTLADVVYSMVAVAAIGRLLRRLPLSPSQWIVIVLSLLAVFSLVRGLSEFGLEEALNEFRSWLRFFSAVLYFCSVDIDELFPDRLRTVWLWGAAAMGVLVVVRWASWLRGLPIGVFAADYDSAVRVLNGPQTFFLALGFLLTLPAWTDHGYDVVIRRVSVVLSVGVVLLNRRTVWAALISALVVLALRNQRLGRRLAVVLVVGAVATVGVLINLPEQASEGGETVARGVTDTGTFDWRTKGWVDLLAEAPDSNTHLLFGQPMGFGYERQSSLTTVEAQPHNFYLQLYLRLGVVGVVLFLGLYTHVGRVLLHASRGRATSVPTLLFVLFAAHAVWLITWAPGLEQGILAGVYVSATHRRVHGSRSDLSPVTHARALRRYEV
jgi:hypothetical protein